MPNVSPAALPPRGPEGLRTEKRMYPAMLTSRAASVTIIHGLWVLSMRITMNCGAGPWPAASRLVSTLACVGYQFENKRRDESRCRRPGARATIAVTMITVIVIMMCYGVFEAGHL